MTDQNKSFMRRSFETAAQGAILGLAISATLYLTNSRITFEHDLVVQVPRQTNDCFRMRDAGIVP